MKRELMKKLMEKKADKKISPIEKDAKMSVIKDMQDMASQAMGDKLHGLKKVTVAAPDEEGLKTGLEKAGELVDKMPKIDDEMSEEDADINHLNSPEEEEELHGDIEDDEDQDMSEEELDQKLEALMKKKAALRK